MSVVEAGAKLRTRMWKTRGSRFAARGRLRGTNILSVTTVTLLSVYVIAISIVLLAFSGQLHPLNEKWLNVATIILSLLVIVFSLIEFSRDYLGWAEAMNQSALKIGDIYGELNTKVDAGTLTESDLDSIERRYSEALSVQPANHEPIDYMAFQLANPNDFDEWWLKAPWWRGLVSLRLFLQNYWLYWASMIALPVIALIWGKEVLTLRA